MFGHNILRLVLLGLALRVTAVHAEVPIRNRPLDDVRRSADAGDPAAMREYLNRVPYGPIQPIEEVSRRYFIALAYAGDPEAQAKVGLELLRCGRNPGDAVEGVMWLSMVPESKDPEHDCAMVLASAFASGSYGLPKNREVAKFWAKKFTRGDLDKAVDILMQEKSVSRDPAYCAVTLFP